MKNAVYILLNLSLFSCLKETTVSPQSQLKSDTTAIFNYLKENGILDSVIKIQPGLWYKIDFLDTGVYPVLTDSLTISYGAFSIPSSSNGNLKLVASSGPDTLLLSSAIAGIQLSLPKFPAGSSGELYIASGLAFGVSPHIKDTVVNYSYNIPPNSNLLYKLKLQSVMKGTQLTNDVTAIDSYITSIIDSLVYDSIKVFKNPSGLRYAFDSAKVISSTFARFPNDMVTLTYTAKILNTTKIVDYDSMPTKRALTSFVTGLKILLPKIPEGTTATLYVPSGYAYGSASSATIPANSNLVYQIKLIKVN